MVTRLAKAMMERGSLFKTSLDDDDEILIWHATASLWKNITWANIKASFANAFLAKSGGALSGQLGFKIGAADTQVGTQYVGWTTGNNLWSWFLEANKDYSLYSYDFTTGANIACPLRIGQDGKIVLAGDPTAALNPATKQYVDKGAAKAWAAFKWDGSNVVIMDSNNVASITRASSGDYTVNFTNAFASGNYAMNGNDKNNKYVVIHTSQDPTASACRIQIRTDAGTLTDATYCSVVFHGTLA